MRQVFFDPFGSYGKGESSGQQDQMALEAATRNARQTDWAYNNMNSLALQQQRNATAFDTAQLPYNVATLPLAYRNAQLGVYGNEQQAAMPSMYAGDMAPFANSFHNAYGYAPDPNTYQRYRDWALSPNNLAWYGAGSQRVGAEGMAAYRGNQGALYGQEVLNMQDGRTKNNANQRGFSGGGDMFGNWDSMWHNWGGEQAPASEAAPAAAPMQAPVAPHPMAPHPYQPAVPGYTAPAHAPQDTIPPGFISQNNWGAPAYSLPAYRNNYATRHMGNPHPTGGSAMAQYGVA